MPLATNLDLAPPRCRWPAASAPESRRALAAWLPVRLQDDTRAEQLDPFTVDVTEQPSPAAAHACRLLGRVREGRRCDEPLDYDVCIVREAQRFAALRLREPLETHRQILIARSIPPKPSVCSRRGILAPGGWQARNPGWRRSTTFTAQQIDDRGLPFGAF